MNHNFEARRKISLVYVTYFDYKKLWNNFESLIKVGDNFYNLDFDIIVVDNSLNFLTDSNKRKICKRFSEYGNYFSKAVEANISFKHIISEKNIGLAKAFNLALELVKNKIVVFLNCDTHFEFTSFKAFRETMDFLEDNDQVGIIGPTILDSKRGELNNLNSFHPIIILVKPLKALSAATKKIKILSRFLLYLFKEGNRIAPQDYLLNNYLDYKKTNWISGCFMVMHKRLWSSTNGLDKRYFIYMEDVDFCRSALELGFSVLVNPRLKISHFGQYKSRSNKNFFKMLTNVTFWHHFNSWIKYIYKWRSDFFKMIILQLKNFFNYRV